VNIPISFVATRQADFVFPYSHGLLAAGIWSALAAAVASRLYLRLSGARWRPAILVAAAVFSHWLIDALVHRPEMPLAGRASLKVGLALWSNMPIALSAEAAIVVMGLCLFLSGSGLGRAKSIAFAVLSLLILALTLIGMTVAPPPPSAVAMAGSSLVTLALVCVLFLWFGRASQARRA
jgi:hypothetical protein